MYCGHFKTARKGKYSSFLIPAVVGGRHSYVYTNSTKYTEQQ